MEITETKFQDEQENTIQFIRKDAGENSEVIFIESDGLGNVISQKCYFYLSGKLQKWTLLSESGEIISNHKIEYSSNVWDTWHKEFDTEGKLLKQTFYTWDNYYQAKAELYYDAEGKYLGKKIDSLKDGKYHPLFFDKEGVLILFN